jgi:hypothetical protein
MFMVLGLLRGAARIAGGRCLFVPLAFVLAPTDVGSAVAIVKPTSKATAKEIR